ncbi:MAG: response regulator [Ghiorsea sp.]
MSIDLNPKQPQQYNDLLREDLRNRVYPISFVTAIFLGLAAVTNLFISGMNLFAGIDVFLTILFFSVGFFVKEKIISPWFVTGLFLSVFMALFIMTILYSGSVHGILFNYIIVPFVAFYTAGMRVGRVYTLLMLAILSMFIAASAMSLVELSYNQKELSIFLISLTFSTIGAWLFESVREKTFKDFFEQGLKHATLMNAIDEVYYRVGMDGMIQDIDDAIIALTGYTPSEVEGNPIAIFYANPTTRDAYIKALKKNGNVKNYPIEIVGKQGQHVVIAMSSRIVLNAEGVPQYIEGMFRDITEEEQVKDERKEHLAHLQQLTAVEDLLSDDNLEYAIQSVIKKLLLVFSAERAYLSPVMMSKSDDAGYAHQFLVEGVESKSFDLESFIQDEEVKFYLSSMPKRKKKLVIILDDSSLFSNYLLHKLGLSSYVHVLFQTNAETFWLLGLHNFPHASMNAQEKRLLVDISRRIGSALNQLLLQRALEAAVVKAEVASKTKGDFVATISHELRTPLHGIIGLLDLMELEAEGFSLEQQQNLALAQTSTQVLRSLIDDVLDLSKIESGKIEMQKQAFSVHQLLCDALIPFVMKAREKNLGLSLEMRNVAGIIEGDVQRLRQVLLNLVGNAIKFTMHGYVRIVASQDESNLYIHIEDSGIGIDSKKQAQVFSPFTQVHNEQVLGENLQEKGTGLGTTIAQYFIKMMGGRLSLQSEPNVGSTMTICLPLQQVGLERVSVDLHIEDLIKLPKLRHKHDKKGLSQQIKVREWSVLLAEDDPVGRRVVVKRLQRTGFKVETAADGIKAFAQFQAGDFDLLLTDVRMPGFSGLQLTQKIRDYEREHQKSPLTIIGLSAYAMEDVKKEALQVGMDDFITKPVDLQFLISTLEEKFSE